VKPIPPLPPAAASLVVVPGAAKTLSRTQKRFNELSATVRERREALAGWIEHESHVRNRSIAEIDPLAKAMQQAIRWQMLAMHRVLLAEQSGELAPPPLGKARRKRLLSMLLEAVNEWLDVHGPDAEVAALCEHWAPGERARELADELDATREMLSAMYGPAAVRGIEAETAVELEARFAERMDEREDQRRVKLEAKRQKRARASTKARPAAGQPAQEGAKARAERQATQSVKDVYRRLAGALHPDRESDPVERERKLDLMKRVNQAYEARDLLSLLTIQVEIEQVDADHLAAADEQRLRAYCDVLLEQLFVLEREIDGVRMALDWHLGTMPQRLPARTWFDTRIDRDRDGLRRDLDRCYDDTAALAEPVRRNSAIDSLVREWQAQTEGEDDALVDAFGGSFDDFVASVMMASPMPNARAGKRGPGQRRRK